MAVRHVPWISAEEFLDQEEQSETKRMYYAGIVTAMAGGTFEHGVLAMNLGGELRAALRGAVARSSAATSCFKRDRKKCIPTRTSWSCARDRGDKSHEYRASPTLRQYAMVSQDRPLVEIHTRGGDGYWRISEVSGVDADCAFSSLECSVPMAALYEGVLES